MFDQKQYEKYTSIRRDGFDVIIHIYCADAQMNEMVILAIRPRCAGSIIREGRTDPMKPPKNEIVLWNEMYRFLTIWAGCRDLWDMMSYTGGEKKSLLNSISLRVELL